MALDVLEWGIIILMGAGILIWGPDKIPDMAKTLAAARKQVDGATKQLQGITKELQTGLNTGNLNMDTLSNALLKAGEVGAAAGTTATVQPGAPGAAVPVAAPLGAPIAPPAPPKSADQMLIEMARILKIDTHGKTKDEISKAITDAVAAQAAQASETPPAAPAQEASPAPTEQTQPVQEKETPPTTAPATQAS